MLFNPVLYMRLMPPSHHQREEVEIRLHSETLPTKQTDHQVLIPTSRFIGFIPWDFWHESEVREPSPLQGLKPQVVNFLFFSPEVMCSTMWLEKPSSQQDTLAKAQRNLEIRDALKVICILSSWNLLFYYLPNDLPFVIQAIGFLWPTNKKRPMNFRYLRGHSRSHHVQRPVITDQLAWGAGA